MHFERLTPHHGGPTEFAALPAGSGEVVVVLDPDPERSAEEILEDCSQTSYREEEPLSEESNVSLLLVRRHWMDTRLRTRMRAGGCRLHYQQFDYSTTEPERVRSGDLLSLVPNPSEAEPPALVDASMLPMNNLCHLNLPIPTSYHYSPNLKLFPTYLKHKMLPRKQQKQKCQ